MKYQTRLTSKQMKNCYLMYCSLSNLSALLNDIFSLLASIMFLFINKVSFIRIFAIYLFSEQLSKKFIPSWKSKRKHSPPLCVSLEINQIFKSNFNLCNIRSHQFQRFGCSFSLSHLSFN